MKKLLLFFLFFLASLSFAQTPPYNLQISQQPLPIVGQIAANKANCSTGGSTFYYWVIARYGLGNANPSAAGIVANIQTGGACQVVVGWGAPASPTTSALTYDVLRTTTNFLSGTCTNCLLQSASSSLTVIDTFAALGSYTLRSYNNGTPGTLALDNVDSSSLLFTFNGITICTVSNVSACGSNFISSLTTNGTSGAATVSNGVLNIPQYAGGAPSGPAGAVQSKQSGVFYGDSSFVYQDTTLSAAAPLVTKTGTGTSTWSYKCVPVGPVGMGLASFAASVTNADTLGAMNVNHVTCTTVTGAVGTVTFNIFISTAGTGGATGFISWGQAAGIIFDDSVGVGNGQPEPNSDKSQGVSLNGNFHADSSWIGPISIGDQHFSCGAHIVQDSCGQSIDAVIDDGLSAAPGSSNFAGRSIAFKANTMSASSEMGLNVDISSNDMTGVAKSLYGIQSSAVWNGAVGDQLNGARFSVAAFGGGTVTDTVGLLSSLYVDSGVTSGYALAIDAISEIGGIAQFGAAVRILSVGDQGSTVPNIYGVYFPSGAVNGGTSENVAVEIDVGSVSGTGSLGINVADPTLNNVFAGGITSTPQTFAAITAGTWPSGTQLQCSDCQVTTIAGGIVTDSTCKSGGTLNVPVVYQGATLKCAYLP